ncbi:hypothetical protein ACLVWU_05660 [Bdellovibrio sp. HCB290]|uniref:hypothetical protein n=1 Tax=Bdellovibrio sp. HCB290 TaxID=3394356 RepID=UPI0039B601C3
MKNIKLIILFLAILSGAVAQAKDLSILFIGNSYIYLPSQGTPEDPALPKIIGQVIQSIDSKLNLKYAYNTPGGYTYEKHLNDPKTQNLLQNSYDSVILQGQSIESLELPPEWHKFGIGVQNFSVNLPKVIDLALVKNSNVTVFVNWGWNFKNSNLQPGAEGLLFPPGSAKAGQRWCGADKFELQQMIDASYQKHATGKKVTLSMVGNTWLTLQKKGLVGEDDLYLKDDWSHPSVLGSYVEALVLTRDALKLDISKATFVPAGVDQKLAKSIRELLTKK